MLLLAAALAGGIAVGSGLLRLPWQDSAPIEPAGIAPCELVSGGSSREISVSDDGVPGIGAPNVVDYEDWVNREGELELFSALGGKACFFLLPPDSGDSRRADSVLHFRSQATSGGEARELAATIFAIGPSPFDQGAIVEQVGGHRAWVGILGERPSVLQPIGGDRWLETFTPRMAVAISAEPYFFVVTFHIDESILGLSDAAWTEWWERQWESAFWPSIRTPVEGILTRLAQQHSTPIDPAGIAPCELVSGEPVSGGPPSTDEGVWPPTNLPDDPYQAGYVNRLRDLELFSTVSGRTCSFAQQPRESTGRMTPYSLLLFRSQATTGAEARQLAATIFTVGPSPFDQGPIVEQISGHRAWVGILGEREPMVGHAVWEEFIPRMAVAVSAEPYFFVVTFHISEAILDLSDAAWAKWWEREWESAFWPGIRTPVEEILTRLTQMESAEAD
jgi:hypothetical protein